MKAEPRLQGMIRDRFEKLFRNSNPVFSQYDGDKYKSDQYSITDFKQDTACMAPPHHHSFNYIKGEDDEPSYGLCFVRNDGELTKHETCDMEE